MAGRGWIGTVCTGVNSSHTKFIAAVSQYRVVPRIEAVLPTMGVAGAGEPAIEADRRLVATEPELGTGAGGRVVGQRGVEGGVGIVDSRPHHTSARRGRRTAAIVGSCRGEAAISIWAARSGFVAVFKHPRLRTATTSVAVHRSRVVAEREIVDSGKTGLCKVSESGVHGLERSHREGISAILYPNPALSVYSADKASEVHHPRASEAASRGWSRAVLFITHGNGVDLQFDGVNRVDAGCAERSTNSDIHSGSPHVGAVAHAGCAVDFNTRCHRDIDTIVHRPETGVAITGIDHRAADSAPAAHARDCIRCGVGCGDKEVVDLVIVAALAARLDDYFR